MPLTLPEPPANGLDVLREVLDLHRGVESVAGNFTAEAPDESLAVAAPHQVYFVGLDSVARGELLSAAELVGWRYLLLRGDAPHAAAELSISGEAGGLEFSSINEGPFVESTVGSISLAEGLEEIRADDYEVRLLKIPGLNVVVLWLKGGTDVLIPLGGSHTALSPDTTYTEAELITALRGPALDVLKSMGNRKGA